MYSNEYHKVNGDTLRILIDLAINSLYMFTVICCYLYSPLIKTWLYVSSVVSAWQAVPMCSELASLLSMRVREGVSYAVRSSAVDEDSLESSAAGQNATVLGCVGLDAVIAAVHQCWASLFTYRSVEYRRLVLSENVCRLKLQI